jgi:hypothetical protein
MTPYKEGCVIDALFYAGAKNYLLACLHARLKLLWLCLLHHSYVILTHTGSWLGMSTCSIMLNQKGNQIYGHSLLVVTYTVL